MWVGVATNRSDRYWREHRQYKLGISNSSFPAKVFKSWAIWQNEKDSVPVESKTSQQVATLKSYFRNINANMAPPLL